MFIPPLDISIPVLTTLVLNYSKDTILALRVIVSKVGNTYN